MRARFNGNEGVDADDVILLMKNADDTVNICFTDDDGAPVDLTANTLSVEVYAQNHRSGTPVKTWTPPVTAASAGYSQFSVDAADVDFGPGDYFMWAKRIGGGAVEIAKISTRLVVK